MDLRFVMVETIYQLINENCLNLMYFVGGEI
jgi:hypothetical protein